MAAFGEGTFGEGTFGVGDGEGGSVAVHIAAEGRSAAHLTVSTSAPGAAVLAPPLRGSSTSAARLDVTLHAVVPPMPGDHDVTITGSATSAAVLSSVTFTYGAVTRNRSAGRDRRATGVAHWTPPVAAPPAGVTVNDGYDVAQAFSNLQFLEPRHRPSYTVTQGKRRRARDRIVVGGVDVTYFRGVPTPFPGFSLIEPLGYGTTTLTFPQIAMAFETPGAGPLAFLRPGAPVLIQRVDADTGQVIATDYKGLLVSFGSQSGSLTCSVGGEAAGRGAMVNRQTPLFTSSMDLGRWAYYGIQELRLPFSPRFGPVTDMTMWATGGTSQLDYLNALCASAQDTDGAQWTIMPNEVSGAYQMHRKDLTTIHGTVYADDQRTTADLTRDISEEPNRIFAQGITPQGQRVRFGQYPGLIQAPPPHFPVASGRFGLGTTDADTISGSGITVMNNRLYVTKYISPEQEATAAGRVTPAIVRAIKALQQDAGLAVTGMVGPKTWAALYDLSATGFSLRLSKIGPAAQRPEVQEWFRTASGSIKRRNPAYDPSVPVVDFNIDVGSGFTRWRIGQFAAGELGDPDNWTGGLTFNLGGLVRGDHAGAITDADVMSARELRPGMNLRLPLFAGGITVHVSAVTVDASGTVSVDVDTKARDAMKLWEVIARNRESRQNPTRMWVRDHRASGITKDSTEPWDEVGGIIGDRVPLPGGRWTVFPVVAGQEGTIRTLNLNTNPNAEFCVGVFGKHISPNRLRRLVGNPLSAKGAKRWADDDVHDALDDDFLLYVAGSDSQPCGYYPKAKTATVTTVVEHLTGSDAGKTETTTETSTDNTKPGVKVTLEPKPPAATETRTTVTTAVTTPLTGRWRDDAGFSYHTFQAPVIYVAMYVDRSTSVGPGRIMFNQLEAGT